MRGQQRASPYRGLSLRVLRLLPTLGLVIVLALLAAHIDGLRTAFELVLSHAGAAACIAFFSVCFLVCKAFALRHAACTQDMRMTTVETARLFAEGVAVEAVTWPGKIFGDAYRITRLSNHGPGRAARTLLVFRASSMLVTTALIGASILVLAHSAGDALVATAAILAATVFVGLGLRRARSRLGATGLHATARTVVWCLGASVCDFTACCAGAWLIAGVAPLHLAPHFILAAALGVASTAPLGLGVFDAALFGIMTTFFQVPTEQALASVIAYRTFGPGLTLAAGTLSMCSRLVFMKRIGTICAGIAGKSRLIRSSNHTRIQPSTCAGDDNKGKVVNFPGSIAA